MSLSNQTEKRILQFIQDYQRAYPGQAPTYRQVIDHLNLRSTGTVRYHIDKLVQAGMVNEPQGTHRSLTLRNSVLITEEDAQFLGLDWNKLQTLRDTYRRKVNGRHR
jgi:predicted transcriptional regulator